MYQQVLLQENQEAISNKVQKKQPRSITRRLVDVSILFRPHLKSFLDNANFIFSKSKETWIFQAVKYDIDKINFGAFDEDVLRRLVSDEACHTDKARTTTMIVLLINRRYDDEYDEI